MNGREKRFNQRCALMIFSPRANSLVVSSIMQTADVEHLIARSLRYMNGRVFQEKCFNAEDVKTFYVPPPRRADEARQENVCFAKLITVTDFFTAL